MIKDGVGPTTSTVVLVALPCGDDEVNQMASVVSFRFRSRAARFLSLFRVAFGLDLRVVDSATTSSMSSLSFSEGEMMPGATSSC
jgi:hypothetical protein